MFSVFNIAFGGANTNPGYGGGGGSGGVTYPSYGSRGTGVTYPACQSINVEHLYKAGLIELSGKLTNKGRVWLRIAEAGGEE